MLPSPDPLLALNLMKTTNGPTWGDGTLLTDTAFTASDISMNSGDYALYFVWHEGKIDDTGNLDRERTVVCQVNPYHLDW